MGVVVVCGIELLGKDPTYLAIALSAISIIGIFWVYSMQTLEYPSKVAGTRLLYELDCLASAQEDPRGRDLIKLVFNLHKCSVISREGCIVLLKWLDNPGRSPEEYGDFCKTLWELLCSGSRYQ
jgi:hypothetical protein